MEIWHDEMFIRMMACTRKTIEAMKKAGGFYKQTLEASDELGPKWKRKVKYALKKQAEYGKNIIPNLEKALDILKQMLGDQQYKKYMNEGKIVEKRIKAFDKQLDI